MKCCRCNDECTHTYCIECYAKEIPLVSVPEKTLLDEIAISALTGILAYKGDNLVRGKAAEYAYEFAEAITLLYNLKPEVEIKQLEWRRLDGSRTLKCEIYKVIGCGVCLSYFIRCYNGKYELSISGRGMEESIRGIPDTFTTLESAKQAAQQHFELFIRNFIK